MFTIAKIAKRSLSKHFLFRQKHRKKNTMRRVTNILVESELTFASDGQDYGMEIFKSLHRWVKVDMVRSI